MNKEDKYHVLWLDDDWDPNRDNYENLKNFKEDAEKLYPLLDIETCIVGKAFIERANDDTTWDAFIIDVNVPMSIDDEAELPQDVIGGIVEEIATIVKKQKVLLYCFSGELKKGAVSSKGMINVFLKDNGFSQNKKTQMYFYLKDDPVTLFSDLNKALEQKNGRFKDYPEIKKIYKLTGDKGKVFIDNLLMWENGDIQDLDCNNLRYVVLDIEKKLFSKRFFVGAKSPTFHSYINDTRKDKFGRYLCDVLNEKCRSQWEAAAMNFLARYANSPMHVGEKEVYDKRFEKMIFDSFVIFSKWYVRFMKDFKKSGYNMGLYVNPENPQQVAPITNNGLLGTMSKNSKGAWGVLGDDGDFYPIDHRDPSFNQTWNGNEKVSFSIANIYKTVATSIKIEL